MSKSEAQRLAGLLNSFTVSRPQASTLREVAALLRRQDELLEQALSIMTGEYHLYRGLCPDEVAGWDSIDPDCPACEVITAIRAHREANEPPYWRTTARARDAWNTWHASWQDIDAALAQQDDTVKPASEADMAVYRGIAANYHKDRSAPAQQDAQACVRCTGIGVVGNILDTVTCHFCKGSGNAAPTPPAHRVELTVEEIGEAALSAGCDPDYDDGALVVRVARAIIKAYESKNGIKRG